MSRRTDGNIDRCCLVDRRRTITLSMPSRRGDLQSRPEGSEKVVVIVLAIWRQALVLEHGDEHHHLKSSVFIIMIHYARSSCVANLLGAGAPLRDLLLIQVPKLVDLSSIASGDTLGVLDKATNGSPP